MRTLLKALPDFFLCIFRSLPYLKKPVFIKGDLPQWKVPARLYWDLPSSRGYWPACRFIYLFIFIFFGIHFAFIFSFFIFYLSFIFSFLYLYLFISCETHVQCTREKVNEDRDLWWPGNENVVPCNNEKLTGGYIGLN